MKCEEMAKERKKSEHKNKNFKTTAYRCGGQWEEVGNRCHVE